MVKRDYITPKENGETELCKMALQVHNMILELDRKMDTIQCVYLAISSPDNNGCGEEAMGDIVAWLCYDFLDNLQPLTRKLYDATAAIDGEKIKILPGESFPEGYRA